ncbi:DNA invertase [Bacteroidia bacterium]|nr:DNA invertase [Bacteroidia bacterium]GHT61517.1 DNA invertase [Bacteroidia bacterium]
MVVGYARVSTKDQNLDLQTDALENAGVEKIFIEKISAFKERPELSNLLEYIRTGDTVVVWKLDRLGRSLQDLIKIIDSFHKRKIQFKSLRDNIDTSSAFGRFQLGVFASLAQYENDILKERTNAGLQAARERGRIGGRKPGLTESAKRKAKALKNIYLDDKNKMSIQEMQDMLQIKSKATLYRYLKYEGVQLKKEK